MTRVLRTPDSHRLSVKPSRTLTLHGRTCLGFLMTNFFLAIVLLSAWQMFFFCFMSNVDILVSIDSLWHRKLERIVGLVKELAERVGGFVIWRFSVECLCLELFWCVRSGWWSWKLEWLLGILLLMTLEIYLLSKSSCDYIGCFIGNTALRSRFDPNKWRSFKEWTQKLVYR